MFCLKAVNELPTPGVSDMLTVALDGVQPNVKQQTHA